jgi:arylformamidase
MPVYPGDPAVEIEPWMSRERGDPVNVARLTLGTHTGTHVDAPRHCSGGPGVDRLALDVLIGPALVADVEAVARIDAAALHAAGLASRRCRRLLLRTPPETAGHGALTEDGAQALVQAGVRLLGVGGPSVDAASAAGLPVHDVLLGAGVIIVENLNLSAVPPGEYELICLPLPIRGGDGAPARAVLVAPHRPGRLARPAPGAR